MTAPASVLCRIGKYLPWVPSGLLKAVAVATTHLRMTSTVKKSSFHRAILKIL